MNARAKAPQGAKAAAKSAGHAGVLQRKCACGGKAGVDGECEQCRNKRLKGIQRKAISGGGRDRWEREADRIARMVTSHDPTPESGVPATTPVTRADLRPGRSDLGPWEPAVASHPAPEGPVTDGGRPLDSGSRRFFETRFGHDLSRVRIHTGSHASELADQIDARAFTVGSHIAFAAGEYAPGTSAGRLLLGHELTHVLQQRAGGASQGAAPPGAQRSLKAYVTAMNRKPEPDWVTAAEHLNGEKVGVINQILGRLPDTHKSKLHEAARTWPGVCSNIGRLTEPAYLKVHPGAKPTPKKACTPRAKAPIEVRPVRNDREIIQGIPEYLDGKVYAVGVRLLDQTYHLFIHGRSRPLTLLAAWYGNQDRPINTNIYPSRERAIAALGGSTRHYGYWQTDEGYVLPTHFTPFSAPRISQLTRGSLDEAAKYGKEIFSQIFIGMIAGKAIEGALAGVGYVVSRTLRHVKPQTLKSPAKGRARAPEAAAPPAKPGPGTRESTKPRTKGAPEQGSAGTKGGRRTAPDLEDVPFRGIDKNTRKVWDDLQARAEKPTPRQTAGGYRSTRARAGDREVIIVEGPVQSQIPQKESMAKYGGKLEGEHATHAVGLQLGENLPEGLTSATARFNTSDMKVVENAIRKTADAAAEAGSRVETRTVLRVEHVRTGGDEIPVLVGVEREAWVVVPGSDKTVTFAQFKARLDPRTRAVVIETNKVSRPSP